MRCLWTYKHSHEGGTHSNLDAFCACRQGFLSDTTQPLSPGFTLRPLSKIAFRYALNTNMCLQKMGNEEKASVVVVVVVTIILCLRHAIVIEMIPWHTGLIPPEVSFLEHEAKRVREDSTHNSVGAWSGSPLLKRRFCSDLKLNRGV